MSDCKNPKSDHLLVLPVEAKDDRQPAVVIKEDGSVLPVLLQSDEDGGATSRVHLEPCGHREDGLFHIIPVADEDHKGPARVNSDAFHKGWEATFGLKPPKDEMH